MVKPPPLRAVSDDTSVRHFLSMLDKQLTMPNITDVAINRPGEVWVEQKGRWTRYDEPDLTFDVLMSMATAVARYNNRDINSINPFLSAQLPDGERIQMVLPPACEDGTVSVTIRKPSMFTRALSDYEKDRFFDHIHPRTDGLSLQDQELLELKESDPALFLRRAIKYAKNIAFTGETGSGKTTIGKAVINEMSPALRLATIEDTRELVTPYHPNRVHLLYPSEAKPDDPLNATKLLKSCLRMKPDRILLAEVRGPEAFDFINVAASGHTGSITSFHANSAETSFERLALMCMQHAQASLLPWEIIMKMLYQVIDVVIHVHNDVHSDDPIGRHITGIYFDPKRKREANG